MVFKKHACLAKIARLISESGLNIHEVLLLDKNDIFFKKMVQSLKNRNYKYASRIYQAIHSNKMFFIQFFDQANTSGKEKLSKSNLIAAMTTLKSDHKNM